ncbi:MAG: hypothetical protein KKA30_18180 [Alphaproteobacteria bacterium]|nr:hypothetical protein [Alphaproteobacteria bacterium]
MNASRPLFPTVPGVANALALLAGSVLLTGCVGNPFAETKIDPASPVAADVARMSRAAGKFPTFASIPKAPTDIRPLAQYGRDAKTILAEGAALEQATAPGTWTLQGTDDFAEKARKDAGPQVEPPKPGDAEAFARSLRERATPPPPR